jgi:outer membrane lipoprotein carrier protein
MKIKYFIATVAVSVSTLSANILNISSIESNFMQVITNSQNAKVTYRGRLYATQKSNKALWEYTKPVSKKIYYEGGGKLVIIEPELEQAVYAKLNKVPNILKLLEDARKTPSGLLVTNFNGIKYFIKTEGNKIKKVSYTDEMQNRVNIIFSNEKINGYIDNRKFVYQIPANYDILEQ